RRTIVLCRSYPREISRHPAGCRLSRLSRSRRETNVVRFARGTEERRHQADRILCDASRCKREWPLFFASRRKIFRSWPDRRGPGGGLGETTGRTDRCSGKAARAESPSQRLMGGNGVARGFVRPTSWSQTTSTTKTSAAPNPAVVP